MTMRVIECNECGHVVSAHDDESLAQRLLAHVQAEHPDVEFDAGRARGAVDAEAYSASDN
jgi:hypothetical protein